MAHIAIIGSGISGMGAAYLLHRGGHTITVYEKADTVGGHTRTRTVDYAGTSIAVDTGFIVYNEPNYPNLIGLFRELGVPTKKSDMSFAITVDDGRFEWGARSINAVFGQRQNLLRPDFYCLIRDVIRFNARALTAAEHNPNLTLGALLEELGLGRAFCDYYLLPMGGAIWSCPPQTMLDFPAATFVQFFKNHGLLSFRGQHQWYTVHGGAREYITRLIAPWRDRIRTHCAVVGVERHEDHVTVRDNSGNCERYDEVVFACHANETLGMLRDATEQERTILGAFTYQRNTAYLHRDLHVMPKRKRCWASWVYQTELSGAATEKQRGIGVTYWMNSLQSIDEKFPLFVTLNPARPIDPSLVFDTHVFEHPVFTSATLHAQTQLPHIQGKQRSWFCGAYTRYGFHEDGLLSAVNIARAKGVSIPWQ